MYKTNKILIFAPLTIATLALLFHLFSFYYSPSYSNEKWISFLDPLSFSLPAEFQWRGERAGVRGELTGANKIALGQKIDINQATIEDLAALPAIGRKLAEKIVEDRNQNGPFKNIEDLMRVRGVKEKKLEKLRPYVQAEAQK